MTTVVGDYRLIATLGRGGMADVYLAARRGMVGFTKLVVIKQLRTDLAERPDAATYRTLLLDEARLAALLRHPNIVQTFEVDEVDGTPYMAMEYLDGQPLLQVLTRSLRSGAPIPLPMALRVVADVLTALDYAHELVDYEGVPQHVVHRDVSPHNVFWTYDGEIKLMDFGVAKFALGRTQTEAGMIKGKLGYMAPEQARGQPLDRRADVFAAGILLWELVAQRRLLRADSDAATLQRLLFEPLPTLDQVRPDIDPAIAAICARALERDLTRRYPTAAMMRDELERAAGAALPARAALASFVAPLFERERTVVADRIRDALRVETSGLVALPTVESESAHMPSVVADRAATLLARPQSTMPLPRSGRILGGRGGMVLGALGALALMIAGGLAWRELQPAAAPAALRAGAGAGGAGRINPLAAPVPADLRLCGSNTIGAELAPALVAAFLARKGAGEIQQTTGPDPDQRVVAASLGGRPLTVEIRAAGTATGFDGLAAGDCDLGMASRAVNDEELARLRRAGAGDLRSPATEHVIGLDGIAVVVHPNNRVMTLDRGALHDVFTGKVTDWGQLGGAPGPITVMARDDKSGTYDTFKHLVLGKSKLRAGARRFVHSDGLADAVASDPSAIGFIGLAYVRSAKALAIGDRGTSPMLPTSFTVATEAYMLSRRLYWYTTPRPRTPLVAELVSFALSASGQAVVQETSFIDLTVTLTEVGPCGWRCPRRYAALVAGAQRASIDFRFRTGSDHIDSRAVRDLDRIVHVLRDHPAARLMLFGFSDSAGDRMANLALSRSRARTLARELATRGVRAAVVDGFGAAMPVAPNTSATERERNRRVEVWLTR